MSLYDDVPLSDLDRKARQVFGEQVVVKSLAQQTVFHGLPRYVSEYLIAKYVKPETWRDDLAKIQAKIKDLLEVFDRGRVAIVMEGDKFLGIITRTDLLSYLRLHMPKSSVPTSREYS